MDLAAAGLHEQPFRTHGRPVALVSYASWNAALEALNELLDCRNGLVLLQGPPLSGKTTLVRHFADTLEDHCATAVIDGSGLNTVALLQAVLRQFGYEMDGSSTSELLAMLRVFCMQQTASENPPILIIENTHALNPSALRVLCELANIEVRHTSALKIVLTSNRSMKAMVEAPAMECIGKRVSKSFHLRPMSSEEARNYLHTKLVTAGSDAPDFVLSRSICTELWQASGGWPGILDRVALLALANSSSLPVSIGEIERPSLPLGTWNDDGAAPTDAPKAPTAEPARVILTTAGKTVGELVFDRPRLLVGRSEHNDICIDSKFVSRHHLLLVRHGTTTFMMDLNSTNGTYVNSQRVSNHVLIDGDILSVGHHRIKFIDPHATTRGVVDGMDFSDTAIMKTLEDMRNLLAQENTAELPAASSENLPTYAP